MDPAIMRLTRQMVAARNSAEARVMERRLLVSEPGGGRRRKLCGGFILPGKVICGSHGGRAMCEPETRRLGVQLKGNRMCGRQSRAGGWEDPWRSILGGEDAD